MRVLIVDDSVAFRSAIKAALVGELDVEVVGTASNGKIGLAKMQQEVIDIVIMDLDMPEMDGLETLRAMKDLNLKLTTLIYAAPSAKSYTKVAEALRLGAHDFLAKSTPEGDSSGPAAAIEAIRKELLGKLRGIAGTLPRAAIDISPVRVNFDSTVRPKRVVNGDFVAEVVVIASSTGGPMALERLFANLHKYARVPILLVQHMPKFFTEGLARRIEEITGIRCQEAIHGESLEINRIYVAPGDFHMSLVKDGFETKISLDQGPQINYVRPAADPLFSTAAKLFKDHVLGFVLTGMGEDGKLGAAAIRSAGGAMMIQDRESSVVWGMPGAVAGIDAFDRMGSLEECADVLAEVCKKKI